MAFQFFKKDSKQDQSKPEEITVMKELTEEEVYQKTAATLRDLITPIGFEIKSSYLVFSDKVIKTLFILDYPKFLNTGWLSPIINFGGLVNISMFFHPVETEKILTTLRKRATQLEAQYLSEQEKGLIRNPELEQAIKTVEELRDTLIQGVEKMFYVSCYLMIVANNEEELDKLEKQISGILKQKLVLIEPAVFQQFETFESVLPLGKDNLLDVKKTFNSGPASTFFPFISPDLYQDNGILYGINIQNNSLVIFDRFSLENANAVIFAKSGAGKSYFAKLDVIRSLMTGTDIIIIDPENEYQQLSEALGGSFFRIAIDSKDHLNPFDIGELGEDETPQAAFREHILDLIGLIKVMIGEITPEEETILDQAIRQTYAARDITPDTPYFGKEPPLLEDLETILLSMENGKELAQKIYKYTKGTLGGFINQPTTVDINNRLTIFSIRDLDEELRPVAMYLILNHIWNTIRKELKKRIMIVDEAWWMMKNPDSANFLLSIAKRSRKYYLGLTTITQDVDDFLRSPYGKPIITNASIQILMKQAPASIDSLSQAFVLSDTEKNILTSLAVGEGLLFAGEKHLAIRVVASYIEDQIITTNPEQLLKRKQQLNG